MQGWSDHRDFAARGGEIEVPLTPLPDHGVRYYYGVPGIPTPFNEAVERVLATPDGPRYYVHQLDLNMVPALEQDVRFPYPDLEARHRPAALWVGSAGSVSRLHFDLPHNFAAQFRGRKRFYLVPPHYAHRVYSPMADVPAPHFSPISLLEPDFAKFPRSANLEIHEAVLEPGDALFLPSLWWHQVVAESAGIMINWFWNTPSMADDEGQLGSCLAAFAAHDTDLAHALAQLFEATETRRALLGQLIRLCLQLGERDRAREIHRALGQGPWATLTQELFEEPT